MSIIFFIQFILLIIFNYLDLSTTLFIVSRFGTQTEKNPFIRLLMNKYGPKKGLLLGKSIIIFITPLIFWSFFTSALSTILILAFLNLLYSIIVANNYRISQRIDKKYPCWKFPLDK